MFPIILVAWKEEQLFLSIGNQVASNEVSQD
jgi:hypothetical protein